MASYVCLILLTVLTIQLAHDLFFRANTRGRPFPDEHVDRVAAVIQRGMEEGEDFTSVQSRLAELEAGTPFKTVMIGTSPAFPYPSTLAAEDLQRHRARGPGPRGPLCLRSLLRDGAVVGVALTFPRGPGGPHHRPDDFRKIWAASLVRSLVIATCLALLAAIPMAGHLTRPLRHLERAARRFAQGDLSARSTLRRGDEIGSLAGAFNEMADSIQRDIDTRTRLLNDVSHELATPVTTIRATAEALLDGVVPGEDQRRYLESLLRQAEHLSYLVDDVTEVARFESGEIRLEWSRFAAAEPVQEAAEAARMLGARVELTSDCDPQVSVEGDPRRILQVLQNLIGNAQHHNPPGTVIRVGCQVLTDRVVYSVEDDGPPIPAEDVERIFERFYKLDSARVRGRSGGGLGLAIVKQIVEAHHSRIRVEQGKRFSFELTRAV